MSLEKDISVLILTKDLWKYFT